MENQSKLSHQNHTCEVANPCDVPAAEGGTVPQPEPRPEQPHLNIPSISEDTAREAFLLFASSKCFYSAAPAKDGVITSMEAFNAYRYCLETFTESRSSEWTHEPYTGQTVDAFAHPPPGLWDVPAKAPRFFKDSYQVIKVPHMSSVKRCHICVGMGGIPCIVCAGSGNNVCLVCSGCGYHYQYGFCNNCNGSGRLICHNCDGQGLTQCGTCDGKKLLLFYVILTVKWTNNWDDYVVDQSSGLKVDKLRKVSGNWLFRDSQHMVDPVMGFPDPVVHAAQRLVRQHQGKYSQASRILQQRQTIELIPITKVTYSWEGESHLYFVYGNEFKVNADNYPATCCCSVM